VTARATLPSCLTPEAGPADGHCWPTSEQTLLLRAALSEDSLAREAWDLWQRTADLDRIDHGSYRLLPLLYHRWVVRAGQASGQDPLLRRLKGVYLKTWYWNHVRFHRARRPLEALAAAGIPTVLLKGMALALTAYEGPGLRPMEDIDILVRERDLGRAIGVFRELGWSAPFPRLHRIAWLRDHAVDVRDTDGFAIDLHWRLIGGGPATDVSRAVWKRLEPLVFEGVPTHTLGATDQFFHVCVHGLKWSRIPPWRWAADTLVLLRHSGARMDWSLLRELAARHHFVIVLREALKYLRGVREAAVPSDVLETFERMPAGRIDRMRYLARVNPPRDYAIHPVWGSLPEMLRQYGRETREWPALERWTGFPVYWQVSWGADDLWELPLIIASRVYWRFRRILRRALPRITGRSSAAQKRACSDKMGPSGQEGGG